MYNITEYTLHNIAHCIVHITYKYNIVCYVTNGIDL